MRSQTVLAISASLLLSFLLSACGSSSAEDTLRAVVRIAEVEIDPAQLETYKALLREEIDASIRLEPGVLSLYAVSLEEYPAQVRIFETYADAAACNSHLQTPHFQKYKKGTLPMVKSLRLLETDPISLGVKRR